MNSRPPPYGPPASSPATACASAPGRLQPTAPAKTPAVHGFSALAAAMAGQPLHEIGPASAGDELAALGFTLGLAAGWAGAAGIIWVGEQTVFAEQGAPYPPGLAEYGLDPAKLIVVRARKREEALWAAEQGLAAPGAMVICALGASVLDLKATRRLLLLAERNRARCLLLRAQAETSAAWTRWRVSPASSMAAGRELGAPSYRAELIRNRAGPSGAVFILDWNSHARAFTQCVARDLSAASGNRPADPIRARA